MHEVHDERRVPIPFEPAATQKELGFWATMLGIFRHRRNRQDAHRAKAVERNQADRRADALRQLRQPGLTEAERAAALRVLATVGTAQSEARGR
jgi:hypothetical protein